MDHNSKDPPEYFVTRCKRRSLCIRIFPNLKVEVRAPIHATDKSIEAFVKKQEDWIQKTKTRLQGESDMKNKYSRQEEMHFYLGSCYRLETIKDRDSGISADNENMLLVVRSPVPDEADYTKKLLRQWYAEQAELILPSYYSQCREIALVKGINAPESFSLKPLRSCWGNCSRKKEITLSSNLIKLSPKSICYVILHEFCHLHHFNHSPRFWKLVSEVMPDYETCEKELKEIGQKEFP